jgi:hypothetical protein
VQILPHAVPLIVEDITLMVLTLSTLLDDTQLPTTPHISLVDEDVIQPTMVVQSHMDRHQTVPYVRFATRLAILHLIAILGLTIAITMNLSLPPKHLAMPSNHPNSIWYPDSGAMHHLTSDMSNLNLIAEVYTRTDQIHIGNGKGLSIHHIGNTRLLPPSLNCDLLDVLYVPLITKNLISVHKFTKDTNTFFEFRIKVILAALES